MLSRVAERIYWAARYMERAENTARLLSVYTNLLLDLPRGVNIGWYNLIILNCTTAAYDERYRVRDERNVVKFMLADDTNPNSILQCIRMLRENVRTTRDVVPADTWEFINELYLFTRDHSHRAVNRGQRHEVLDQIIQTCQQINGLLAGAMVRDAGWEFLILGRNLERADMTTRILESGVSLLRQSTGDTGADLSQLVWGNVLRSLNAYLPYRRSMRIAVRGEEVARYLVEDPRFPRTVTYCINHMTQAVEHLPKHREALRQLRAMKQAAIKEADYDNLYETFPDYVNSLQLQIAGMHHCIADTWFAGY